MRMYRSLLNLALIIVLAASLASCGKTAKISAKLGDVADADIIVKLLDVNKYEILDTVKTDKSGNLKYKIEVSKNQPEFVYLFYKETKIASLLLERGESVEVVADTLGNFKVEGSEETQKLIQVEKDFADFISNFNKAAVKLEGVEPNSKEFTQAKADLSRVYIDYYRDRVKFVMSNSFSLTVVPVLFQSVGNLAIFGQPTDAIHFKNTCDSLETVYPESKYVKALRAQAKQREQMLGIQYRINEASEVPYPEIALPNMKGETVKLSEVKAKVVLLHFWQNSEAVHKMFNLDVLLPIYNEFNSKGLEIYQVAADVDKSAWAATMRAQKLPWVNVCDGAGLNSHALMMYNIKSLPTSYFIVNGKLVDEKYQDAASLRKVLNKYL